MKKILIIFILGSTFYSCHKLVDFLPAGGHSSSSFNNVYGGSGQDEVLSILITNDGGYFLGANNQSTDGDVTGNKGDKDVWAVKLDKNGAIEWQKSLGGSNYELIWSAAKNNTGGYILAGQTSSTDGDVSGLHGFNDAWIVNLNHEGNVLWQKALGGSIFEDFEQVITSNDHGYIAVGATNSNDGDVSGLHSEFTEDGWIVKLDGSGNIIWQKTLGGTGSERFHGVIKTFDGGYLVVGHATSTDGDVHSNDGGVDAWVVKLDGHGNIEWEKTYGGSEQESFTDVTASWDGGFILIGSATSDDGDVTNYHGGSDMWVVKINHEGHLQ